MAMAKDRMKLPVINADQFTATQWQSKEDKRSWTIKFCRFIMGGCRPEKFSKQLYERLNGMFSHIAHYDRGGFANVWFSTSEARNQWLTYILERHMYGNPEWTWSDVEQVVQKWVREHEVELRKGF